MQCHLDDARLVAGLQASHLAEELAPKRSIGIRPIRVVQNVEGLRPELQIGALAQGEVLQQRCIYLRCARTGSECPWSIPECVGRILLERGGVEPLGRATLAATQIGIAYQIRSHSVRERTGVVDRIDYAQRSARMQLGDR